ncbi:hypothetical protein [Streptomyces sp. YIM 121038]|uniref:hypothetical protein n=1 Tax=Streptomyces sp. YIM 121038 TaxID=2136401 RepID=UPI002018254D|nr:hypothetical protein [Streptomyces sp. YIM 121038]
MDGCELFGLGAAIGMMMTERGLAAPAVGDSVLATAVPELAERVQAVVFGPDTGRLDVIPDAPVERRPSPDGYHRAIAAHRQAAAPSRVDPDQAIAEAMERQTAALRGLFRRAFLEPDVVADDVPAPIERRCQGEVFHTAALWRARAERVVQAHPQLRGRGPARPTVRSAAVPACSPWTLRRVPGIGGTAAPSRS